jgi:hypothetical protein
LFIVRSHSTAETSVPALMGGVAMPNGRFYIRNHFQIQVHRHLEIADRLGGLAGARLRLTTAGARAPRTVASPTLCMSVKVVCRYLRFAEKSNPARRAATGGNRGRPNLQTRRPICKHTGAKMLMLQAFQNLLLTAH